MVFRNAWLKSKKEGKKKKILFLGLAVIAGLWMAEKTMAGDYHSGSVMICSDCHTMHYSLQHDYSGGTAPTLGTGGPFSKLLRDTEANLCLSCHDGKATAPDVVGTHTNAYVRAAGGLNKSVGTETNYEIWKGHTLGSTTSPPGGTWTNSGLSCSHCHETHGSANYRNLRTNPGTGSNLPVTFQSGGVNDYSKDVFQTVTTPMATHYSITNIAYNRTTGASNESAYGAWCGGCHGNFHTRYDSSNYRHPTKEKTIDLTYFDSHTNKVPIMRNASSGVPSCMSCHKAHGNQNPFALIYMAATGAVTEEGVAGRTIRDLCTQCHNK